MGNVLQQRRAIQRRRMVLEIFKGRGGATGEYITAQYNKLMQRGRPTFKLPADMTPPRARDDLTWLLNEGFLTREEFMDVLEGAKKGAGPRVVWLLTKKGATELEKVASY